MTFRLRHEWHEGMSVPTLMSLSTCPHCETLRAQIADAIPYVRDRVHFIRRAIDPSSPPDRRTNLVLDREPPCIGAPPHFVAPW